MTNSLSRQRESLEMRAARYFGWHDKPRRSVRLNNTTCIIVGEGYGDKVFVMHYSEQYRPTGDFIRLTPRALKDFVEALEEFYVAS